MAFAIALFRWLRDLQLPALATQVERQLLQVKSNLKAAFENAVMHCCMAATFVCAEDTGTFPSARPLPVQLV